MKKNLIILLTTLMLISIQSITSAHTFIGGNEKEIKKILNLIEVKLGPLNEELTFYSEKTKKAGYKRLVKLGVKPEFAKTYSDLAAGFTMPNKQSQWIIIIRENTKSKSFLEFALCHELIHRYQINSYPIDILKNRNLIEGEADIVTAEILNLKLKSEKNNKELENFNNSKPYDSYKLIKAQHYYAYEYCKKNNNMIYYKLKNKL